MYEGVTFLISITIITYKKKKKKYDYFFFSLYSIRENSIKINSARLFVYY